MAGVGADDEQSRGRALVAPPLAGTRAMGAGAARLAVPLTRPLAPAAGPRPAASETGAYAQHPVSAELNLNWRNNIRLR